MTWLLKYFANYLYWHLGLQPYSIPRVWRLVYAGLAIAEAVSYGTFIAQQHDRTRFSTAPVFCELTPRVIIVVHSCCYHFLFALPGMLPRDRTVRTTNADRAVHTTSPSDGDDNDDNDDSDDDDDYSYGCFGRRRRQQFVRRVSPGGLWRRMLGDETSFMSIVALISGLYGVRR